MKSLVFMLVFMLCVNLKTQAARFSGYFIDKLANRIETIFKLPYGLELEPHFIKMRKKIKYISNGETKILTPGMCQKIGFYLPDKEVEFLAFENKYESITRYYTDSIFLRPLLTGPTIMYYHYYYTTSPGGMTGSFPVATHGWLLEKDDGSILEVDELGPRRKDLVNFFSDYKEMADSIENRKIKKLHLKELVRKYNKWHSDKFNNEKSESKEAIENY